MDVPSTWLLVTRQIRIALRNFQQLLRIHPQKTKRPIVDDIGFTSQQRSPQRTIKLTTPLPPLSTSHGASNFLAPQDKHAIGIRQNPKASNTSQDVSRLRKVFFTRRVISFSAGSLEVRPDSAHIFVLFFVYSLVACLRTCPFLRGLISLPGFEMACWVLTSFRSFLISAPARVGHRSIRCPLAPQPKHLLIRGICAATCPPMILSHGYQ